MLKRLGNKTKLLPKLLPLFPENITTFIDMFMGSGVVTFAMVDRAKYIIANDNDEEVFNLFMTVKEHKEKLEEAIRMMPIHEKLFQYWEKQEEHDCVWKVTRFIFLSNFSLLGMGYTLHLGQHNHKRCTISNIGSTFKALSFVQFLNDDFRNILDKLGWRYERDKIKAFVYADPPYIGTGNNYQNGFTEKDTEDLFEILVNSGIRFGLSEFDNPFILEIAKQYGLFVTESGDRKNLKNRRVEISFQTMNPSGGK